MNLTGILTSALVLASIAALLTMSCYWNPQGGAGKISAASHPPTIRATIGDLPKRRLHGYTCTRTT